MTIRRSPGRARRREVDATPLVRGGIIAEDPQEERGLDRPLTKSVDADALPRELDAELTRQRVDGPLRRRVRDLRRRCAHQRDEGGDVEHRASAALE